MIKNIKELLEKASSRPPLRLAVAAAGSKLVLESVIKARDLGIIEPILVGEGEKIEKNLRKMEVEDAGEVINVNDEKEAACKAMELIAEGKADFPMKGLLSTKTILKALLDEKYGLRQGRLLSLVTVIHLKEEERLVILTDGGMNIAPDLKEKAAIINNAVTIAKSLGIVKPKVAPLAAVEKVNPAMPATMDAALLSKMADRGQIKDAIVDGPLALDNALSLEAAKEKGIDSPVAGRADILLVPNIETGNVLYKSLIFYTGLEAASLVFGARVPLVLTSRADRPQTKLNSIALAKVVADELLNNN